MRCSSILFIPFIIGMRRDAHSNCSDIHQWRNLGKSASGYLSSGTAESKLKLVWVPTPYANKTFRRNLRVHVDVHKLAHFMEESILRSLEPLNRPRNSAFCGTRRFIVAKSLTLVLPWGFHPSVGVSRFLHVISWFSHPNNIIWRVQNMYPLFIRKLYWIVPFVLDIFDIPGRVFYSAELVRELQAGSPELFLMCPAEYILSPLTSDAEEFCLP